MDTLIVNFVFLLLILVSVATWTIAFMKYKQLKQVTLMAEEFNKEFWNAKNWKDGEKIANDGQSDLAAALRHGPRRNSQRLWLQRRETHSSRATRLAGAR